MEASPDEQGKAYVQAIWIHNAIIYSKEHYAKKETDQLVTT